MTNWKLFLPTSSRTATRRGLCNRLDGNTRGQVSVIRHPSMSFSWHRVALVDEGCFGDNELQPLECAWERKPTKYASVQICETWQLDAGWLYGEYLWNDVVIACLTFDQQRWFNCISDRYHKTLSGFLDNSCICINWTRLTFCFIAPPFVKEIRKWSWMEPVLLAFIKWFYYYNVQSQTFLHEYIHVFPDLFSHERHLNLSTFACKKSHFATWQTVWTMVSNRASGGFAKLI